MNLSVPGTTPTVRTNVLSAIRCFFDPIFFLLKKNQSAVLVTDRLTYNYSI
jgi:hypothetical protein